MGQRRNPKGNQKIIYDEQKKREQYSNLWNAANAVYGGNLRTLNVYIKNLESKINYPIFHFRKLEKEYKKQSYQKEGNIKLIAETK